jgi:regulator of extracellular matrix RemA (YlzA/DUF370 family)
MITMITRPVTSTSVSAMFVRTDSRMPRKLISATTATKTRAAIVVGTETNSCR